MSLKGDKYETAEEVKFRLEGSVVLYDGKPVYITRVSVPDVAGEIARVFFQHLPYPQLNRDETRKYLSSRKFDLSPFKMGYMNFGGTPVYVSRAPVRQNRQGFSANNAVFTGLNGKAGVVAFSDAIQSKDFLNMVNGVYPTFEEARELLKKRGVKGVAVSRSFAIGRDPDLDLLLLLNKGTKCGFSFDGEAGMKLPKKFNFLKEELEECRIPIL